MRDVTDEGIAPVSVEGIALSPSGALLDDEFFCGEIDGPSHGEVDYDASYDDYDGLAPAGDAVTPASLAVCDGMDEEDSDADSFDEDSDTDSSDDGSDSDSSDDEDFIISMDVNPPSAGEGTGRSGEDTGDVHGVDRRDMNDDGDQDREDGDHVDGRDDADCDGVSDCDGDADREGGDESDDNDDDDDELRNVAP